MHLTNKAGLGFFNNDSYYAFITLIRGRETGRQLERGSSIPNERLGTLLDTKMWIPVIQ